MKKKTARIDSRFATAKETARVLGVGKSRLIRLVRLADSLLDKRAVRPKKSRPAKPSFHC